MLAWLSFLLNYYCCIFHNWFGEHISLFGRGFHKQNDGFNYFTKHFTLTLIEMCGHNAWQGCRAHLGRPKVFWTVRMQRYRTNLKRKKEKKVSIWIIDSEMNGRIDRSIPARQSPRAWPQTPCPQKPTFLSWLVWWTTDKTYTPV